MNLKVKIPIDWQIKKIDDISKIYLGLTYTPAYVAIGVPFISVKDLTETGINYSNTKYISREEFETSTNNAKPQKGDVLFGRVGTLGNPVLIEKEIEVCIFVSLGYFRLKTNISDPSFVLNWMKSPLFKNQVDKQVAGGAQKNLNTGWLKNFNIPVPPLQEQRAIAHVLGLMDCLINKNKQLIAQKELQIKWLMQNLLTRKNRLKGFGGEWKTKTLKNILQVAGKPFTPVEDGLYQQIGIRSHTKGIFYKDEVKGAELGNKRVFWIEPNCFVVNIVFAWEHAIAKTTEKEIGMIASHRFPMYKPKEGIIDLDYLLYYFKSPKGKYLLGLASPGGAGRNKTLGKSEFMKLQIPVPSIEEQISIAQVLQAADKEIQLLKTKTEKLREQKKGMMQVLLTGKKRLKI